MFTGIIQDIGIIKNVDKSGGDLRFEIATGLDLQNVPLGASICCSGCCLTVVEKSGKSFFVDVSAQTLSCTSLGDWVVGTKINIEPSLKIGDEIGGHFVFGHVDNIVKIMDIALDGDSRRIKIALPDNLAAYVAAKGSVALDGISLTVNEVGSGFFMINIIPHTWERTTMGVKKAGDKLNIEVDMLARYVVRAISLGDIPSLDLKGAGL